MAWSNSKIFEQAVLAFLDRTANIDMDADTFKAALYNNTTTPSNTVSAANSAYAVDQWVVANEVDNSTEWDAGGEPITADDVTTSSAVITYDGADTPSGGSSATLADVYGCLVYDDTLTTPVADQGICYNYFGGVNSVTNGTFTIQWNASGIFNISVA
jgi:hypothetical protein